MRMVEFSFFITNFCYILPKANGIDKPDICRQKFLTSFNSITISTCCNARLNIMMKRQKYRMANILNCHTPFLQIWKQRAEPEAFVVEAVNFRVLNDCSNQENLKKSKEGILLNVHRRNILVIQQIKLFRLENFFQKLCLSCPGLHYCCYYLY